MADRRKRYQREAAESAQQETGRDRQLFCLILGAVVRFSRGSEKQMVVARASGVSQSTISRIERGEVCPDVWVLSKLVPHLEVECDAFDLQHIAWGAYETAKLDESAASLRAIATYHALNRCELEVF